MTELPVLRIKISQFSSTHSLDLPFTNFLIRSLSHNFYKSHDINQVIPYNALVLIYFQLIFDEIDLNEYFVDNVYVNVIAPLVETYHGNSMDNNSTTNPSFNSSKKASVEELIILRPYYDDTLKYTTILIHRIGLKHRFLSFLKDESKYEKLIEMLNEQDDDDWTENLMRSGRIDYEILGREIQHERENDLNKNNLNNLNENESENNSNYNFKNENNYNFKSENFKNENNLTKDYNKKPLQEQHTLTPARRAALLSHIFTTHSLEKDTNFLNHLPIIYEFVETQVKYLDNEGVVVVKDWVVDFVEDLKPILFIRDSNPINNMKNSNLNLNNPNDNNLSEIDMKVACSLLNMLTELLKRTSLSLLPTSVLINFVNKSQNTNTSRDSLLKSAVNLLKEDKNNFLYVLRNMQINKYTVVCVEEILKTAESVRFAFFQKNNDFKNLENDNLLNCDSYNNSCNNLNPQKKRKLKRKPKTSKDFNTLVCSPNYHTIRTTLYTTLISLLKESDSHSLVNKIVFVLLVYFSDKNLMIEIMDNELVDGDLAIEMILQYLSCKNNKKNYNLGSTASLNSNINISLSSTTSLNNNQNNLNAVLSSHQFLSLLKRVTHRLHPDYFKILSFLPVTFLKHLMCKELVEQIGENVKEGVGYFCTVLGHNSMNNHSINPKNNNFSTNNNFDEKLADSVSDFLITNITFLFSIPDQSILKLISLILERNYNGNVLNVFRTCGYNKYEEGYLKVLTCICFQELIMSKTLDSDSNYKTNSNLNDSNFNSSLNNCSSLNSSRLDSLKSLLTFQVTLIPAPLKKLFIRLLKILFISGEKEIIRIFEGYREKMRDWEMEQWYAFVTNSLAKSNSLLEKKLLSENISSLTENNNFSLETSIISLINTSTSNSTLFKQSFRDCSDLQKCLLLNVVDFGDEECVEVVLEELAECLLGYRSYSNTMKLNNFENNFYDSEKCKESKVDDSNQAENDILNTLTLLLIYKLCTVPDEHLDLIRDSGIVEKIGERNDVKEAVEMLKLIVE